MKVQFYLPDGQDFSPGALGVIRAAKTKVFGDEQIEFERADRPGEGVISFGEWHSAAINTAPLGGLAYLPNAVDVVARAFRDVKDGQVFPIPFDCAPEQVLYFDIETHSADEQWNLPAREFFRLGQYAWGPTGKVVLTEDYDEMLDVIRSAAGVVGHNIINFDLPALFGKDSMEPLHMAIEGKVYDTFIHANLAMPSPEGPYRLRNGQRSLADSPPAIMKWLGLDNLAYQLGLSGKVADLSDLAKKHGGFCHIPVDDPEFREYAKTDVTVLQQLSCALLDVSPLDAYDAREQLTASIDAQVSRNGFRVDIARAEARVKELAERKAELLGRLEAEYEFPTTGKQPWRSTPGKAAIMRILADNGITPETRPSWTRTKTGNLSLGGEVLVELTSGTEAEELGVALAELMGQRSLAELALASVQSDGYVHPKITALQRSGRRSTTEPGLTVWSARAGGGVDKAYFIASPGCKLVEMDYSAADNRIVAALAGDENFMERFAPGADAHELTGRLMFGDEVYDSDPKHYRTAAKPITHGSAYGAGAKKLAESSGLPVEVTQRFLDEQARHYSKVHQWKAQVAKDGKSGMLVNAWGRRMYLDPSRTTTQSPALHGQSGTAEIFKDGLIRIAYDKPEVLRWMVAFVHDALVADIPETELDWAVPYIQSKMETVFDPEGGMAVEFPLATGSPADDWQTAGH